jgi:hypothetical protein
MSISGPHSYFLHIAKWGIKYAWRSIPKDSIPDIAVRKTAAKCQERGLEGIADRLRTFLGTNEFKSVLDQYHTGNTNVEFAEIARGFVSATEFYNGDSTEAVAEEILSEFFEILNTELLNSGEGTAVAAAENRHHFKELTTLLDERLPAKSSGVAGEEDLTRRVDDAKDLLNSGQVNGAKSLLIAIRRDIERERRAVTPHLQARIAANLGMCALYRKDFELAEREYQRAQLLEPNVVRWSSNLAYLEWVRREYNLAVQLSQRALCQRSIRSIGNLRSNPLPR